MISDERLKEIRDFAERCKDAVKHRPDLHAFSGYCRDLLKDRDEQTERIAALENALREIQWTIARQTDDDAGAIYDIARKALARVTQEKPHE